MLSLPYPEQETEETREGNEAHALAADGLMAAFTGLQWRTPQTEMGFAVGQYVSRCLGAPGQDRRFEETLPISTISEHCGGTVDFRALDYGTRTLYIKDFKYGHKPVEAFENWQCMLYAEAQIVAHKLDDLTWTVDIEIVQPRCYATRDTHTWRIPAHALRPYINKARAAAEEALSATPLARSGAWCTYCPAVHVCKTALKAGASLYEAAARGMPHDMPAWAVGTQLAIVRRAIKQLEALDAAYTAEVQGRVTAGENCGPWAAVEESGHLKWLLDDDTVAAMIPHLCKTKPPTPTQARDAGVDVTGLADRPKVKKLKAVNLPRIFNNSY
jgi:hypothetical protein